MRTSTWFLLSLTLAVGACGREHKPAHVPTSDIVVQASAEQGDTAVTLTLSAVPPDLGMDDRTYAKGELVDLVVRANGTQITPTGQRYQGTLNGGDLIVTLPLIPGASSLTLEGTVVVRNSDGTEIDRAPVPATVEIR